MYGVWPSADRLFDFPNVADSYRAAADSIGGLFAPAGEAWQKAWAQDSTLPLYAADAFHPSTHGHLSRGAGRLPASVRRTRRLAFRNRRWWTGSSRPGLIASYDCYRTPQRPPMPPRTRGRAFLRGGADRAKLGAIAQAETRWQSVQLRPGRQRSARGSSAPRPPALIPHFIGGERQSGRTGRTGLVFNPSTGQVAARVVLASRHDVDDAVSSGERAFAEWSSWSPLKRARVMFRFRELLEEQCHRTRHHHRQ